MCIICTPAPHHSMRVISRSEFGTAIVNCILWIVYLLGESSLGFACLNIPSRLNSLNDLRHKELASVLNFHLLRLGSFRIIVRSWWFVVRRLGVSAGIGFVSHCRGIPARRDRARTGVLWIGVFGNWVRFAFFGCWALAIGSWPCEIGFVSHIWFVGTVAVG